MDKARMLRVSWETKEERREVFFVCTGDKAVCLHCEVALLSGGRVGGWKAGQLDGVEETSVHSPEPAVHSAYLQYVIGTKTRAEARVAIAIDSDPRSRHVSATAGEIMEVVAMVSYYREEGAEAPQACS